MLHWCFILPALHIASGSQHADCVRILLQHGAKDCQDNSGNTAKSLAIKQNIKDLFGGLTWPNFMVTQLTNMTKDHNIFDITFIQHKMVFYMYYMAITNQAPTDNSCKTLDFFLVTVTGGFSLTYYRWEILTIMCMQTRLMSDIYKFYQTLTFENDSTLVVPAKWQI